MIAQAYEVLIDDILYHFLNVSFTCSSGDSISDAVVFEIKLIVGFKDAFAVDIIAVHLVQDISFAKEGDVIDDSRGRVIDSPWNFIYLAIVAIFLVFITYRWCRFNDIKCSL